MKLWTKSSEREQWENMAELYSIVTSVEHLEKAYIRDVITADQYTPECTKLIAQFKTALNLVRGRYQQDFELFMQDYQMHCPAAQNRLKIGVPATIEHVIMSQSAKDSSQQSAKYVAETVQFFITLMDSLKLNLIAVDQIHPVLADLMQSLNKLTSLPPDYQGRGKIKEWLVTLNKMKASDELSPEQARQLMFDLEQAHTSFYRSLSDR